MGILSVLSFLFSTDPKKEIEECKKRIENFESIKRTVRANVKNKKQKHYHDHARERIKTLDYQISKEREKIAAYRKKVKK
ncbi:hypothetical protein HX045_05965 [Myroides odoratimimus]|uniref:Uncharacterized protein n=1 Tax=Myroides odoratimimus TaxID=76832 RepID=A0AAI8G5U7_9FLAO|nr:MULTISPECIES: hypothetical protein [Myroides]ALU27133.1 hypothetical protein AS202_13630 [Myroides odoratimimus]APA93156.1 hypothetical protein BK054_13180 [Myroides sp. ZB35]EKB07099.1 hypothetical protein HMPREF9711_00409 [Myroides odoratimimus CCUG 3837]MCA4792254.1 hypothetical protein [Myroides odoratimimus]MCA4806230.1 hypothetical protein [Myroides odoratimimus]